MTSDEDDQRLVLMPIENELKTSFLDYAMSVIVSRALPDVRDGLKPVHRRILYAMWDMGLTPQKPFRKSALVVGDTMGKYHPHGDSALYDALVRMAQSFSLRAPLIDGHGNFGSVDGDDPAAMRYTESRLAKFAVQLLEDIEKETVDFAPNYDASRQEPVVLPSGVPNLLVNGASGIAVGMATNMPPHNLGEVIDATVHLIDNPAAGLGDLMQFVQGPDFPTGGIIMGRSGIVDAYSKGRGRVVLRAKHHIEELRKGRNAIIVTELPYAVNKANLLINIADMVRAKRVDGISDLRDESDREGMRVVIELKRDADAEVLINQLFSMSQLQVTFGVLNLALVKNRPVVLGIKQIIDEFVKHRVEVVTRRTRFDLQKAQDRAHILEGLLVALDNIDAVIKLIRASESSEAARQGLVDEFELTEVQAKAILDMRLAKLAALESQQVRDEHTQLLEEIRRFQEILGDSARVLSIIKDELTQARAEFADERRTEILETEAEGFQLEELIVEHEVVITITRAGYIKRLPLTTYHSQGRGGQGIKAVDTKEDDFLTELFVTSSHDTLLFFTSRGRVHRLKAFQVPEGSRYVRGKAIPNLLPRLEEGERVQQAIPIREFSEDRFVFMATRGGYVKKTPLVAFQHINIAGMRALRLDDDDEIISVRLTDGGSDIILATARGQAIRFTERYEQGGTGGVRAMGRTARGVRGIRLRKGDHVVSMALPEETNLLSVTRNGYGKRTPAEAYPRKGRGGMGVRTIVANDRNGPVVDVRSVGEDEDLILTTRKGMLVRIRARDVSVQGRNTMGVRVMRLKSDDQVVAVVKVLTPFDEAAVVGDDEPPSPSGNGDRPTTD